MDLRMVDPKTLVPNPNNPRRIATDAAYEAQLLASIREIGLTQPPVVRESDGKLVIKAGDRRARACIEAGLETIPVLVLDADDANLDSMRSFAENTVRAGLGTVDMWRAVEALAGDGWTDDALATALAIQPRLIKRLRLCGSIHPAILEQMARGDEPSQHNLRTIAAAPREEQAQAWKKHKPKKGENVVWHNLASALAKRRYYARNAGFDAKIAEANGVVWEEDLFEQEGEDNRFTTQADAFLNAQHEWLNKRLAKGHVMLTLDAYGSPKLPPKAQRVYGDKPGKGDQTGYYLDDQDGKIRTVHFRLPEQKKGKSKGKAGAASAAADGDNAETPAAPRPPVTKDGMKMIGDFQTDALHEALVTVEIPDQTLIALLVLAFAGNNVQVRSGEKLETGRAHRQRECIADTLMPGGVLTADPGTIRVGARAMLKHAISLREAYGVNSGSIARIAGDTIGADRFLPNMATQEFLSCLSKPEIERVGASHGILPRQTGKATRAAVMERFKDERFVYDGARFALSAENLADIGERQAENATYHEDFADGEDETDVDTADPDECGDHDVAESVNDPASGDPGQDEDPEAATMPPMTRAAE